MVAHIQTVEMKDSQTISPLDEGANKQQKSLKKKKHNFIFNICDVSMLTELEMGVVYKEGKASFIFILYLNIKNYM